MANKPVVVFTVEQFRRLDALLTEIAKKRGVQPPKKKKED